MKINLMLTILLLFSEFLYSQESFYNTYLINDSNDPVSVVSDIVFLNYVTGYTMAVQNKSPQDINKLYKTTNCGQNWIKIYNGNLSFGAGEVSFAINNNNIGYFMVQHNFLYIWKTTNGGYTFEQIQIYYPNIPNYSSKNVTCVNTNGDLIRIPFQKNNVTVMSHPISSESFWTHYFPNDVVLNHVEVSKTTNTVYVCGKKGINPFLAKSTDNGRTYTTILDGNSNPGGIYELYHMKIYYEGNNEILKISGYNKLAEYRNSLNVFNYNWGSKRKISFSDSNNGFYIEENFTNDSPPVILSPPTIWITTNGGLNWNNDFQGNHSFSYTDRFYTFGNIAYFLETPAIFHSRKLSTILSTYHTGLYKTGTITINGNDLPSNNQRIFLNGGIVSLSSTAIIPGGNSEVEKIFYRWNYRDFSFFKNNIPNFNFSYDGLLSSHFKARQEADNQSAIRNPNQTKAIRDTNGTVHQIHESIGGIFYTRSNDNGATFQREEIVNAGMKWNVDFPEDASALENNSPSLCEIRNLGNGKPLSIDFPNVSIAAAWQHYNPNGNMEIRVASRFDNGSGNPDWYKYGLPANSNGVSKYFPANSSFLAKPVIFASTSLTNGFNSEPYYQFIVVPHLEPSSNGGNKIVVTAKYMNYSIYPLNGNTNDFIIADGNNDGSITDYSVTSIPTYNNSICNGYMLHFAFIRGNKIVYKKVEILLGSVGGYLTICRTPPPYNDETETILSDGDGQLIRYTPDISIRNRRPAITYSGYKKEYRLVQIENGTDEPQTFVTHHFPVIVRCKSETGWETALHYDGLTQQENPNIEGSKNADAYLLNFRKNNSNYQYVKIGNASGYKCSPNVSEGIDAKLVKNCYLGQTGSGAGPLLIKLSFPSEEGLSNLGRQPFSILPTGIETDGFSNLGCVIEKDNTLYSLTLGPIIASNTTYGFDDTNPPQTVHNPIEFNETMISAVFSLSNNDTLILGAHGKYATSFGQAMQPLKYHVNLVNSTTNQIHRELFRDTINVEDSVGIEFLRGYVITDITNGSDQFYVQMIVDTVDAGDGDFMMAGVYSDDTPPEGDAPLNYKTKVFFENSSNSLTSGNQIPKEYSLSQNYPNPFNPSTTIKYSLPKDGFVSLKIYDITGREVKSLAGEVKKAGYYSVTFNASSLASGVYFYRIQSNDFVMTKRMVLIK